MKIGIDLDGTIDKYPDKFRMIIDELRRQGNYIYCITGTLGDINVVFKKKGHKLDSLNIKVDELVVVRGKDVKEVARRKAMFCREKRVNVMIEDTELYLEEIKKYSPGTLGLLLK